MSKITRYNGNVKAFGSNATGNYRTVFGDVTQSDTLDDNLNADFLTGWEIVGPTEAPSKQDFNAMGYALGQLIAYIFQRGVVEWNASQEFYIGSFCSYNGSLYKSLTDSNTGNTPSSSPLNWEVMVSESDLDDYYTAAELDAGQLDNRYYTETELDAGQLDNRYYTETELDSGQLDNRYYTETELDAALALKSNVGHAHDASAIATGTIDIARLPQGALERLISVADQTARYALTTNEVQLGDSVRQIDTGVMYIVIDEGNLGNSAGYQEYTAASATSVPWSGITSKPADILFGDLGVVDNAILRADGTGQYTAQGSSPTIDDSGNVDTSGTITASQLISDVATGTAPLTVASTTRVGNLNSELFDNLLSSQFVRSDTSDTIDAGNVASPLTVKRSSQTAEEISIGFVTDGTWTRYLGLDSGRLKWATSNTLSSTGIFVEMEYPLQGNPTAKTTSTTLTAAEIGAKIITVNNGAAGTTTLTLPLATAMDSYFSLVNQNHYSSVDFYVINTSTVAAEDADIATNTGWTLVGNMDIEADDDPRARSSAKFRARKTGSGAWTLYRLS